MIATSFTGIGAWALSAKDALCAVLAIGCGAVDLSESVTAEPIFQAEVLEQVGGSANNGIEPAPVADVDLPNTERVGQQPRPTTGPARALPVTVEIAASATAVEANQPVTLSWQATNANICSASGAWIGARSLVGSEVVRPVSGEMRYRLSCTSTTGAGAVSEVRVNVVDVRPINVEITVSPEVVEPGGHARVSWRAENATNCIARGDWFGARPLSGEHDTGALHQDAQFVLRCRNGDQEEVAIGSVTVADRVAIRWQAPSRNADGTRTDGLAGYKVYWGAQPELYSGVEIIDDPEVTVFYPELPSGEYYFALSAFDTYGNESAKSEPFNKTIP